LLTLHLLAALPRKVVAFKLWAGLGKIRLSAGGLRPTFVIALLPLVAGLAINVTAFVGEDVIWTLRRTRRDLPLA
jgi:hypothetical protein